MSRFALPYSDLKQSLTYPNGISASWTYDANNQLLQVCNATPTNVISQFDYTYDAAGRRIAIAKSGSAFGDLSGSVDTYTYNARSELTSARRTKNGQPIPGFSEDFDYDPIGNRRSSSTYNERCEAQTSTYEANNLNQYTSRTTPGYAAVRGEAAPEATVTVNENPAFRLGSYYFGSDLFDNSSSGGLANLETYATLAQTAANGDETEDLVSVETNQVYIAQSPETFAYDDDGNQTLITTKTGLWRVTYNGENRPIRWVRDSDNTTLTMAYDYNGRRREKNAQRFFYDGCLQVADNGGNEYAWDCSEPVATRPLTWFSSALDTPHPVLYYTHDGNKNVSEILVSSSRKIVSHYEFAPFGETIVLGEESSVANPWRFSSEFADDEIGCVYYNYRHYDQITGRWIIRDIVDLMSDWPEYGVGLGNMISHHDCLGLFLDELYALDDILSFGVSALRNKSEIILSPDLIELVAADPAMVAFDNELVEKAVQLVVEKLYPLRRMEKTFRHLQFSEKPRLISFGGERAKANMIDQLKGFWKPEYRATWRVAGNPLTWMIRNTHVESDIDIYVVFDCGGYEGLVAAEHKFDDILDLRPRRHSKTDLALLLRPSSDPYDAVTMILGFIWHDMLRRRDDLHVKANWIQATIIGNGW